MTDPSSAPSARRLLYVSPAGRVWNDGLELYQLRADGIPIQEVFPGTPQRPSDVDAIKKIAQSSEGRWKPWMEIVLSFAIFLVLSFLSTPLWMMVLTGLILFGVLFLFHIQRSYRSFLALYEKRPEVTILLSESRAGQQIVSNVIEINPETPAQVITSSQQPVAVVIHGLPVTERVELAKALMQHTIMGRWRKH